jgi:PAS domain S-box-containing protein
MDKWTGTGAGAAAEPGIRLLLAALEAAANAVVITDRMGVITWVNPAFARITGYSREEAVGQTPRLLRSGEHAPGFYRQLWETILAGRVWRGRIVNRKKDGSLYVEEQVITPVRDEAGEITHFVAIKQDVTEQEWAEKALRRVQERFRAIVESALDVIVVVDPPEGTIQYASPSAEAVLGYRPDELEGTSALALVHPEERERARALLAEATGNPGFMARFELRARRKDGAWRVLEGLGKALPADAGAGAIMFTARDITEGRQAEEALRESERRLSTLMSNLPGMVYRCANDPDRTVELASEGALELTGYAPADLVGNLAVSFAELIHPEDRQAVWEQVQAAVAERRPYQLSYRLRTAAGTERRVWEQGRAVYGRDGQALALEGFVTDIPERKALEEQFRQAQKMEAVGRLAGGVAHDFNNLLTVIMGRSHLLKMRLGGGHPGQKDAELIHETAERAAALTRQLLAFSRKQVLQLRPLDLNGVVGDLAGMLRRMIGEDIELTIVPGPALGRVSADPVQVEQILMNLAVNARDAMPEGGRLTIETANVTLDEAFARSHPGARAGAYVMVAVTDTGVGMDAETQARIFEPFFTTKEKGKGTGLGLSTVYGIVKQHEGYIAVESAPGRGAVFRIYFPRLVEAEVEAGQPENPAAPAGGSETILLVEDEAAVRSLAQDILERAGYAVLPVATPGEALDAAARHPGPIALLLTDVVMPRMSGRALAAEIERMRPGTRVLYMSGYTDETLGRHGVLGPGLAILTKPFTPLSLVEKVREVLDAPRRR